MKKIFVALVCIMFCFFYGVTRSYSLTIKEKKVEIHHKRIREEHSKTEAPEYIVENSDNNESLSWKKVSPKQLAASHKFNNTSKLKPDQIAANSALATSGTSSAYTGDWVSIGPTSCVWESKWQAGMGRLNKVTIDPANNNIIYVGTSVSGLFRSTDGGNSWENLTKDRIYFCGISAIVIDPTSPPDDRTIYILTGDGDTRHTYSSGVYKSTDNGNTWYLTGLGATWNYNELHYGYQMVIDKYYPSILIAAMNDGIWKSTDYGASWEKRMDGDFCDICWKPNNPSTLYAGAFDGKVYRSDDDGITWNQLTNGLPTGSDVTGCRVKLAVTPASPDCLYVLYTPNSGTVNIGLYRSLDGGNSFSLRNTLYDDSKYPDNLLENQPLYHLSMTVSPVDLNEVLIGSENCYKSTDGGTSWTQASDWTSTTESQYVHCDIHELKYNGSTVYAATDGGIYNSTDAGQDWTNLNNGLNITQLFKVAADQYSTDHLNIATQDNGIDIIENKVMHRWSKTDGYNVAFLPGTNVIIGSDYSGGYRYTTNDGQTMTFLDFPGYSGYLSKPLVIDPNDHTTLYSVVEDFYKLPYYNATSSWINLSNGQLGTDHSHENIAIAPGNSSIIYVSKAAKIYKTVNAKTTTGTPVWTNITNGLNCLMINGIVVSPRDPNHVWLAVSDQSDNYLGGKVYVSTNGGSSWTDYSTGLPDNDVETIVYQNGSDDRVYCGDRRGDIYYRDATLNTWQNFSSGLPRVWIKDLTINYDGNKLLAATFGRGVWQADLVSDCGTSLFYFNSQIGIQTQEAQWINSSAKISKNSSITYNAIDYVALLPGFSVEKGSSFNIHMNSFVCPTFNSIPSSVSKSPSGIFKGLMPELVQNNDSTPSVDPNKTSLQLFPNPVDNNLSIKYLNPENSSLNVRIKLMDVYGHTIKIVYPNYELNPGENNINIPVDDLPHGIYFIQLNSNRKVNTLKFIKL